MQLLKKLNELKITLPPAPAAAGAYVPAKRLGNLIFVAGQLPTDAGQVTVTGPVPSRCTLEDAAAAGRTCVLNALAAIGALPGGLDQIRSVVRLGVFVQSDNDFKQQPLVANGASEFLIELMGDAGRHVRAAVGTNTLPRDASVEIEFLFEAE